MSCTFPPSDNGLMLHRVLQRANLLQYYDAFISQGGDDVNQLCEAGEDEFLEIMALVGMASKPLHVRRLQKALLEWILHPNMFTKPLPDRRVVPSSVPSRGSIYAAFQQESTTPHGSTLPLTRSVNGNGIESSGSQLLDSLVARNFQPLRRDVSGPVLTQKSPTPNSDDFSDHDGGSNASFDILRGSAVSPSSLTASQLTDDQIAAIAVAASDLAKTLPNYAPKPLNMKKPIDKEIQDVMTHLEDNPNRLDLLRKYSAIYARFDSKRKLDKQMNFHEICVNEAAAQLCRYRPSLLTRREDLFNLARQVVKDSCFQYPKESFGGSQQIAGHEPPAKMLRTKSPTPTIGGLRPLLPATVIVDSDPEASVGAIGNNLSVDSRADVNAKGTSSSSLVDIARVYGLGTEFESELQSLKTEAQTPGSNSNGSGNDADGVSEEQAEWQREVEKDELKLLTS